MSVTTAAVSAREKQLLRSLRPPELQSLPDEQYMVVVAQATKIVRTNWYIENMQRDMALAREAISEGTWPAHTRISHWDYSAKPSMKWVPGEGWPELHVEERGPVFVCWAIEAVAGTAGFAHLHALHRFAQAYHDETPWGKHCPWGYITQLGFNGAVRSWQHGGLTTRVAPLTWALTDAGRELLAVVFGDGQ